MKAGEKVVHGKGYKTNSLHVCVSTDHGALSIFRHRPVSCGTCASWKAEQRQGWELSDSVAAQGPVPGVQGVQRFVPAAGVAVKEEQRLGLLLVA